MESRKEAVNKAVSSGMRLTKALSIAQIPRSTYYYRSNGRPLGKKPSTHTRLNDKLVENRFILKEVEQILAQEFIDYGYRTLTICLKKKGYKINKKKVYRLMKEANMLLPAKKRKGRGHRKKAVYCSPLATYPFHTIEVDIKYIAIHGKNRFAYLVTFLDVFSRTVLRWKLDYQMKAKNIKPLIYQLLDQWLSPLNIDPRYISIMIRSDNGSQFISELFCKCLTELDIKNEFIKAGTPEQNGHIEAYHSTIKKLISDRYYFEDLQEAIDTIDRFVEVYNNIRIMPAIMYMAPIHFIKAWHEGKIEVKIIDKKVKYFFREKPENRYSTGFPSELLFVQNNISKLNRSNYMN